MKQNSLIHVHSLYIKIADLKLWWLGKGGGRVQGALERVATHRGATVRLFQTNMVYKPSHRYRVVKPGSGADTGFQKGGGGVWVTVKY